MSITNNAMGAVCFLDTLEANVNNEKLSDENFRIMVRNSLEGLREQAEKEVRVVFGYHNGNAVIKADKKFYALERVIREHKERFKL